jgi:hypothetical protein
MCLNGGLQNLGCFRFLVKSMYIDYMDDHTKYLHKYLWKIKVPLKIRGCMWFLHKKFYLLKTTKLRGNGKVVTTKAVSFSKNGLVRCSYGF